MKMIIVPVALVSTSCVPEAVTVAEPVLVTVTTEVVIPFVDDAAERGLVVKEPLTEELWLERTTFIVACAREFMIKKMIATTTTMPIITKYFFDFDPCP